MVAYPFLLADSNGIFLGVRLNVEIVVLCCTDRYYAAGLVFVIVVNLVGKCLFRKT